MQIAQGPKGEGRASLPDSGQCRQYDHPIWENMTLDRGYTAYQGSLQYCSNLVKIDMIQ